MRRFLRRVPDGGGLAFSLDPLSFPSLELYLRSDQIVGADGSGVAAWGGAHWPDLSTHARHAVAVVGATSPTLRTTGLNLTPNGTQVVQYGAVLNNLRSFMGGVAISGAAGWTFLAYYKSIVLSAGHNNDIFYCPTGKFFEYVAQSNVAFNGYNRDGRPGFDSSIPGPALVTWDPLSTLGWHMQIVTLNPPIVTGGTVTGTMDGTDMLPHTFTNWNVALEGDLFVGNSSGSNSDLEGTLAALLVFSQALTATQRLGVSIFLKGVLG